LNRVACLRAFIRVLTANMKERFAVRSGRAVQ